MKLPTSINELLKDSVIIKPRLSQSINQKKMLTSLTESRHGENCCSHDDFLFSTIQQEVEMKSWKGFGNFYPPAK